MTTPPPPPPGGPSRPDPDEPYQPPHHNEAPLDPPFSEGYPSRPAQSEPQPPAYDPQPQHGAYEPPPPAYEPPPGGQGGGYGGHGDQPVTGGPYASDPYADPYASGSGQGGQGGYQPQEPYTPPPPGVYPPGAPGTPGASGGPGAGGGGGGGYVPPPPDNPYWPPEGGYGDPYDPIVATDFNTWMNRVQGVFKRSWKSIGALMLVGAVLPGMVLGTVNSSMGVYNVSDMNNFKFSQSLGGGFAGLLAWVITSLLSAIAVVASIRAAVREGTVGVQVPFGESFSYGLRRALPMWGWGLLASLVITVGLCACILPGVYLAIALAVLAPAFVFEGGNPFVRSFKLTHSDFGRALSRLLVAFLVALVYSCIIGIPIGLIEGAVVGDGHVGFGGFIVLLIVEAIRALLMLPLAIGGVAVVLVTYAELRARLEGRLSTQQLVAEADAAANG